jgi:cation:H+ antiporter
MSMAVLVKSAKMAVSYSSRIARVFHISEFIVSFFVIAVISCFPEGIVSVVSAIKGVPEFGLGTLLGSNVADLALVLGIVALFSLKGITIKSEILRNDLLYLVLLIVPILLGFDGHLSRVDGLLLVLSGVIFFLTLSIQSKMFKQVFDGTKNKKWIMNLFLLIISLAFLLASGYGTVKFGVDFANDVRIPPFLVAITIVAIGTCLPELIFSLKAVKAGHNKLALGDVLGTVIIDATILVGVIALIKPFAFNPSIIYVTGVMMFIAGVLVTLFIKSGKILTKKEGIYLLLFYIASVIIQFIINQNA